MAQLLAHPCTTYNSGGAEEAAIGRHGEEEKPEPVRRLEGHEPVRRRGRRQQVRLHQPAGDPRRGGLTFASLFSSFPQVFKKVFNFKTMHRFNTTLHFWTESWGLVECGVDIPHCSSRRMYFPSAA